MEVIRHFFFDIIGTTLILNPTDRYRIINTTVIRDITFEDTITFYHTVELDK